MIAGVALVLNIVATIYPALRASRTVPADELRYE
jgi:ABC-type lipoprotein release transport system permease subunit